MESAKGQGNKFEREDITSESFIEKQRAIEE
jgi:hypothetical protein